MYNTCKPFKSKDGNGHTHLRNIQSCFYAIKCVENKKVPKRCSTKYLGSLIRISTDKDYIKRLGELIDVREQKGKKQTCVKRSKGR